MHASSRFAALAAAAALVISAPASAQVFRLDPGLQSTSATITPVRFGGGPRFRGGFGHGGFRHGGFGHGGFGHRGFGFHRGGYGLRHGVGFGRGYGYRQGFGYRHGYGYRRGLGAGVAGLAAGALIGGALASPAYGDPGYAGAPVVAGSNAAAYCAQRFRSYDPATGTYTGYDGLKHPCP